MHAFYLKSELWHEKKLQDAEFEHLKKVLRLKESTNFILFDGEGSEAFCKIEKIEKKFLNFEILEQKKHEERKNKVILAAAWTKAARRGFLFEKVVELEASELWLWYSEYSQFPLPEENSATVQSWKAQLIAGVKQCHNPFLPKLRLFNSQEELLKEAKKFENFHVFTTNEAPNTKKYSLEKLNTNIPSLLVIGSEGGFSPKEIEKFAQARAQFYTLGERILRYETAAVLVLGLHFWNVHANLKACG